MGSLIKKKKLHGFNIFIIIFFYEYINIYYGR